MLLLVVTREAEGDSGEECGLVPGGEGLSREGLIGAHISLLFWWTTQMFLMKNIKKKRLGKRKLTYIKI